MLPALLFLLTLLTLLSLAHSSTPLTHRQQQQQQQQLQQPRPASSASFQRVQSDPAAAAGTGTGTGNNNNNNNNKPSVWSEVGEFCDWESVNVTCTDPERVLVVRGARYGRLRLNRCVVKNYGHLGCGADVTARFEATCSARRRCTTAVVSLHGISTTCPPDLKAYVELTYDCVKVLPPTECVHHKSPSTATSKSAAVITLPAGLLASVDASAQPGDSSGSAHAAGSPSCPWSLRVAEYQRIAVTLIDYTLPPAGAISTSGGAAVDRLLPVSDNRLRSTSSASSSSCIVIVEKSTGTGSSNRSAETVVCGGRHRESLVYSSSSNVVDIFVANNSNDHEFLIKYEAFGCPRPVAPPGGWVTLLGDGERAVVRCNDTSRADVSWTMTCRNSQWVAASGGDVTASTTACIVSPAVASLNPSVSLSSDRTANADKDVFYGIVVIVSLGVAVGVTVGVLMLILVLVYQRRYKQRKINCRADNYVLKRSTASCLDPPLIAPELTNGVTPGPDELPAWTPSDVIGHTLRSRSNYDLPYDLDQHAVTWSRCSQQKQQQPFPVSAGATLTTDFRSQFDGGAHVVPQYCTRLVPGTQTYCGRHAICREANAWPEVNSLQFARRAGSGKSSSAAQTLARHQQRARRERELAAAQMTSDRNNRKQLQDAERRGLCEQYGLIESDFELRDGRILRPVQLRSDFLRSPGHCETGNRNDFRSVDVTTSKAVDRLDLVGGLMDRRLAADSCSPAPLSNSEEIIRCFQPCDAFAGTGNGMIPSTYHDEEAPTESEFSGGGAGGEDTISCDLTDVGGGCVDDDDCTTSGYAADNNLLPHGGGRRHRVNFDATTLAVRNNNDDDVVDNAERRWAPPPECTCTGSSRKRSRSPFYFKLDTSTPNSVSTGPVDHHSFRGRTVTSEQPEVGPPPPPPPPTCSRGGSRMQ